MVINKKTDVVDRKTIIRHLANLEAREMKYLKESTKDFKKRLYSTRIALIRDIYDFIKLM